MQATPEILVGSILLVSTEPWEFKALANALSSNGYTVRWLNNRSAALGVLREDPPDVVIIHFPVYDRSVVGVCSAFACTDPDLPLIAVGPRTDGRDKADVLAVGPLDYVELPFDTREMIARIRSIIRRASR